ncbi:MAG: thioredoxin family protein, partial [Spirochaetota bacterium]
VHTFRSLSADSFVKGSLAALLATPCSGPLLGAVLAWSLTQQAPTVYAVFISIGTGMALPYLAVSLFPALVAFIPKPGRWTIIFERAMGFLLLGSVIYFISILDSSYFISVGMMLLITAAALWQFGFFGKITRSSKTRIASGFLLIILTAASLYPPLSHNPEKNSIESFSREALLKNARKGKAAVVIFTADWCPNCRAVEQTVLESTSIKNLFREKKITVFTADMTEPGTEAEALLRELGGSAIPFLAVFPAGKGFSHPLCLRDMYTREDIRKALEFK